MSAEKEIPIFYFPMYYTMHVKAPEPPSLEESPLGLSIANSPGGNKAIDARVNFLVTPSSEGLARSLLNLTHVLSNMAKEHMSRRERRRMHGKLCCSCQF